MKVLLSPAKKLDFETKPKLTPSKALLADKTQQILQNIVSLKASDIKKLMKLSDALSELNYNRYQEYKKSESKSVAGFAFVGDTYQGFDIRSLKSSEIEYATKHVFILSGLYGVLRINDEIKPYRLEMGTPYKFENFKNLYDFWKDDISKTINTLNSSKEPVVNLASEEYFKSVKRDCLDAQIIDIKFLENKNGVYKTIGIMAKRARGMMARYIVQNKIKTIGDLQKFTSDGYSFDKVMSTETNLVFKR